MHPEVWHCCVCCSTARGPSMDVQCSSTVQYSTYSRETDKTYVCIMIIDQQGHQDIVIIIQFSLTVSSSLFSLQSRAMEHIRARMTNGDRRERLLSGRLISYVCTSASLHFIPSLFTLLHTCHTFIYSILKSYLPTYNGRCLSLSTVDSKAVVAWGHALLAEPRGGREK